MEEKRVNRRARAWVRAPLLAAIAALSWTIACGDGSPSQPSEVAAVRPEGDVVAGVTSPQSLTTAPPPTPGTLNHGILLAYDQPCPACTLITPRGTALVWFNTEIAAETPEGVVPITFDELNEALQPGQPLKIRVDNLEATQPVAQTLVVERRFATTGTIDRSSEDVRATGVLVLTITDERAGVVAIPYVLAEDSPVVADFDAVDRVYLSGIVADGKLVAQLVRLDE